MPWAMPPGAKLQKDKVSAVLLPRFEKQIIEASPSSMQCMLFVNCLICKEISTASMA